ncbi:MAG: patatin-like phospholipase family protein [Eubacteriales bacterium]|nr:patatin-like phospholipase family protein [Eubacteriales bacterium]
MSERPLVGIALGGGASRGLAHVGVLKVLREHRIPIDLISGCSMGAVVGGIVASGCSLDYLEKICVQMSFMDSRKLYDVVMPRKGFIRGDRALSVIYTLVGDKTFDQLDIPFSCVTTCLEDAKLLTLESGRVVDAIRASISVPGIFEPVMIDGKMCVDGGVMDRVPVKAVRDRGADFVIAVDVAYHGTPRPQAKNLVEILYHSYELMEWQANRSVIDTSDFLITPDTMPINPATLDQAEECIQLGYEAAASCVDDIITALRMANIPLLPEN